MAKTNHPETNDVVVVDIKPFLQPAANIISALIIAGAILLSGSTSGRVSNTGSAGTTTSSAAVVDPNAAPPTTATTNIDDDPVLGNRNTAQVAIIEFSDYECPFCQRFYNDTLGQIKQDYIDSGKAILVYRDLPLSFHTSANRYARAVNCTRKLSNSDSAYYQMHDLIFTNAANGEVSTSKLGDYGSGIGVDKAGLESCINATGDDVQSEIDADSAHANSIGISGTPGFVVGKLEADGSVTGDVISGAYPFATFQSTIDKYLQ